MTGGSSPAATPCSLWTRGHCPPTRSSAPTPPTRNYAASLSSSPTPVYKAAYSGLLKCLLDLLPQHALAGKTVLPLATGGSTAHVLAIDYALRPVLSSMGANHIVQGWFLLDRHITVAADGSVAVEAESAQELDRVLDRFADALSQQPVLAAAS